MAGVLAASLPLQAPDIYSHLKDAGGGSCCDNRERNFAEWRLWNTAETDTGGNEISESGLPNTGYVRPEN
jgi:hypothetical protein